MIISRGGWHITISKLTHFFYCHNRRFIPLLGNQNLQSVSKLTKPGFSVLIEKGAGSLSHFSDADYEAAGAKIVEAGEVWKNSDIVMKVSTYMTANRDDIQLYVCVCTQTLKYNLTNT